MTAGSGGPANLDAIEAASRVRYVRANEVAALVAEVKQLRAENERLERECYERSIEQQDAVAAVERARALAQEWIDAGWVSVYESAVELGEDVRRALDPGAEPGEQR